jgi:hypothetical protein
MSRMLAMKEHDGDEDLRGSVHRSVTPYVNGRFCVVLLLRV